MTCDMPRAGALYRRVGGGFISLHVGVNGECSARIMADRWDVGYTTGLMPVASFWEMVDVG